MVSTRRARSRLGCKFEPLAKKKRQGKMKVSTNGWSTQQINNNWVLLLLITCNNLSASTLAIFSSLDNSWKIQKLTRNNQSKWSSHMVIFVCAEYKNHPRLPEFWHLCSERLQARLSEWWTHRRRPQNTHLPGYWAAWTSPLTGNPQSRYVRHRFSQHQNLRRRKLEIITCDALTTPMTA